MLNRNSGSMALGLLPLLWASPILVVLLVAPSCEKPHHDVSTARAWAMGLSSDVVMALWKRMKQVDCDLDADDLQQLVQAYFADPAFVALQRQLAVNGELIVNPDPGAWCDPEDKVHELVFVHTTAVRDGKSIAFFATGRSDFSAELIEESQIPDWVASSTLSVTLVK